MGRLSSPSYLSFPLRVGSSVSLCDNLAQHVEQVIEQVLLTAIGERIFRPDFGAGIETLVFEPGGTLIWQLVRRAALGALADALAGEVDPRALDVQLETSAESLVITVSYQLPALGAVGQARVAVGGGNGG